MRQLTSKYPGECAKCSKEFQPGDQIMYEKYTGVFCIGCEPTDPEEIREYRIIKAEKKAARKLGKAERLEKIAADKMSELQSFRGDIAFFTQPIISGHSGSQRFGRYREKVYKKFEKGCEMLSEADKAREQADNIMIYRTRVKGDAERKRAAYAEELSKNIKPGSRVFDAVFGAGTVKAIFKKSFRVEYDRGFTYTREKHYFKVIINQTA